MSKTEYSAKTRMASETLSLIIIERNKKLTFSMSHRGMKMITTPNVVDDTLFPKLCKKMNSDKSKTYGAILSKLCTIAEEAGSIANFSRALL